MREHFLRRLSYVLSGIAIMGIGVFAGKGTAFADTGSFTVTGGIEGIDYNYNSTTGELKILTSTPLTIGTGGNVIKDAYINVAANNADITLGGVYIIRGNTENATGKGAAIVLSDSLSDKVTIRTAEGSYNSIRGYCAPAIQKNDSTYKLVLAGEGSLNGIVIGYSSADYYSTDNNYPAVIGGASGHSGNNITVESGTYTLHSYAGGGACIGGGYNGGGSDITISGGNITAEVVSLTGVDSNGQSFVYDYYNKTAAAIGGGSGADGNNILIKDGTITATVKTDSKGYGGAAIGGGSDGEGTGITISGGEITASVTGGNSGAAIGGGAKSSSSGWTAGTDITITGGKISATGYIYSPAIGNCGDSSTKDSAVVNISGGTIVTTRGSKGAGIGGHFSDVNVYITGGTVNAEGGTSSADAIGLSDNNTNKSLGCLKNLFNASSTALKKLTKTVSSLKNKKVKVVIAKDSTAYAYGTDDMYADGNGNVYLYLPATYTESDVQMLEAGAQAVTIGTLDWDYTAPYYYKNADYRVKLKNIPKGIKTPADSAYSNNKKSAVSATPYQASVTLEAESGYYIDGNATQTLSWEIQEYPAEDLKIYYNGKETTEEEYDDSVKITASTGYTISDEEDGTYSAAYTATTKGVKTLYFKNSSGYIVKRNTANLHIVALTPVDMSGLKWTYTTGSTHLYYKNAVYEVSVKTLPEGTEIVEGSYKNNTATAKGSYTATVELKALKGFTISDSDKTQSLSWSIEEYPSSNITILYDGKALQSEYNNDVTVTATGYTISDTEDGTYSTSYTVTSSGARTLYFKKDNDGYITSKATEKINIDRRTAVDVSSIAWSYTDTSVYYYTGKSQSVELALTNAQKAGVSVTYANASATGINKYTATATIKPKDDNYKLVKNGTVVNSVTSTRSWEIKEYSPTITLLYNGETANENKWYIKDVEVTAEGHKIRVGSTGDFASSVTISKTGEETLYFMSNDGGYVTTTGLKISVKIDKTLPAGNIAVDGVSYKTISSGKRQVHMAGTSVSITTTDSDSGIAKTEYAVYTGDKTYTSSDEIEAADTLSWKEGKTCTLGNDAYQAVYVRITDNVGNKSYISTPLIYNDTQAPAITEAKLTAPSSDTENTIDYSFTLNESSNYYYVLKKATDEAPSSISDITSAITASAQGGEGYGKTLSGTFRKLTYNTEYVMYVMADDGMKTLSGADNANSSAISKSNSITTTKKEVPVSDQIMYVKAGSAMTYTYDPWSMLKSSSKTDAEKGALGVITYDVSVGDSTGGKTLVSGDVVVASSADIGHNVLQIPIGTGFNVGDKQTLVVTFKYGDEAYSLSEANLTIEAVAKNPVTLDSTVGISNITYGEAVDTSAVTSAKWKDASGEEVPITGTTSIKYTGVDDFYDNTAAPSDAGTYKLTVSLTDSNYIGEESYTFVINRKDLSDVSNVKWSMTSTEGTSECNNNATVYYDGKAHTVSISGYPEGLKVTYTDQTGKDIGEYHTKAEYSPTAGSASNYILPNPSNLTWSIVEKPKAKTVIDVNDTNYFGWKYYKGSSRLDSGSSFIEDGTTVYSVEVDESILPEGIDVNYISYENNKNTAAGTYTAKATFEVDKDQYEFKNEKDYITLVWTIQPSVESNKTVPDMSNVRWIYSHVKPAEDEYVEEPVAEDIEISDENMDNDNVQTGECTDGIQFVWDGNPYTVEVTGLPTEVTVESYNMDASRSEFGEYEAEVQFKVSDTDKYIIPKPMTLQWSIVEEIQSPKSDIDLNQVRDNIKWKYSHGDISADYIVGETKLVADGIAYKVFVDGLPNGVTPEYNNTEVEKTDAGEYIAVATLVLDENIYNPVSEDEDMTITLNWAISPVADPVVTPPEVTSTPDVETTPMPVPAVAQVGTVVVSSGANYKILSASSTGGTVEYEGQEKVNKKATSITIPATVVIDNVSYEVTAIKSNAFSGYSKLKKVTIGGKVTKIGSKAFYKCTSLKSVVIPAGVTEIGAGAFQGCKKLNKITIKSKVLKKVGKNAIKGIKKKATIKCPTKKLAKSYKKKLFKSSTGYKKTMKIK